MKPTFAVAFVAFGVSQFLSGQTAGQPPNFGARPPATCPSRKDPGRGAPSSAQALKYFTCDNEYLIDSAFRHELHLVSEARVDVGSGRPFDVTLDHPPSNEGIDVREKVYPVKGSFVSWTCAPISASEVGKNCLKYIQQDAVGTCYKTNAGDWHCRMIGRGNFMGGQPPPK